MMGVGKSTVGRRLAKKLSFDFIDIDKVIEEKPYFNWNDGCREIHYRNVSVKNAQYEIYRYRQND